MESFICVWFTFCLVLLYLAPSFILIFCNYRSLKLACGLEQKSKQRRISEPAVMYTSPGSLCYSDNEAPATLFSGIIYKQSLRAGLMLNKQDRVTFKKSLHF